MRRTAAIFLTWMLMGTLVTGFLAGPASGVPVTIHWFSDGSTERTLDFNAQGYDSSLSLSLKKGSTVSAFTIDVEGLPKDMGGPSVVDHTFNSTSGVLGWDGTTTALPPSGLTSCQATSWGNAQNTAVQNVDKLNVNVVAIAGGLGNVWPCVHMQYTVNSPNPESLSHEYYGNGTAGGGDGMRLYMYNHSSSAFDLIDTYNNGKMTGIYDWFYGNLSSSNASNYVSPTNTNVDVIITSLNPSNGMSAAQAKLYVDFVKLVETGATQAFPDTPSLDVGADGDVEWSLPGHLTTITTVPQENLTAELQSHIDAAGKGDDNVTIPLKFYSGSEGFLKITNITIDMDEYVDMAPELNGTIPNDKAFNEDTSAPGLIDLALYFKDEAQASNTLNYSIVNQSDQTKIKATLAADGHHLDFTTPTKNWYGTQSFKVRASDHHAQFIESSVFTVTVHSVNDVPAFVPIGDRTATEGTQFNIEVKATDDDFGFGGDTLAFSISTPLIKIEKKAGTNDTAIVSFTPSQALVGKLPITVTVKDKVLATANETFNITVEDVNHPPVFQSFGNQSINEGQQFKKQAKATDSDGDKVEYSDDTDLFTVGITSGMMEFTAKQADVGIHTVTITASDGKADTPLVFTLTVVNKNDAPAIEAIEDDEVDRGTEWTYTALASDPDIGFDPKEKLTFSMTADPALSNMSIDGTTGEILVITTRMDVGKHTITVKVKDAAGLEATAKFELDVLLTNTAPTAAIKVTTAKGVQGKAEAGENITLKATADDKDGDALTFKWEWTDGTQQTADGEQATITIGETGVHNITLTVSDGIAETKVTVDIEITGGGGGGGGGGKGKQLIPGFEAPLALVAMAIAMVALLATRKRCMD